MVVSGIPQEPIITVLDTNLEAIIALRSGGPMEEEVDTFRATAMGFLKEEVSGEEDSFRATTMALSKGEVT